MAFRWTVTVPSRHGSRVSLLAALFLGLFAGTPGWAATVERVDLKDDRVVIRFDDAVGAASSFLLAGPDRIAIDVDGAWPGQHSSEPNGMVAAVRQARNGGNARIVLDLSSPAVVEGSKWDDDGRALELRLRSVDQARFVAASAAAPVSIMPWNWGAKPTYKVSRDLPPVQDALPLPRVKGDDDLPLVVIDAGHGGVDPGAINQQTGLREKDVTLAIAKAIRDKLVATGRVRAALTREDDRYILHRERFGIARRLHADLFISIHCDSVGSGSPSGATAYTLSDVASDKEAALLAARENKSDVINGVNLDRNADVSSILIDLTQRETMNASAGFARLLGREALPLMPTKANFHRTASLLVLKAPDMPSILFETGYISTPQDAAFLDSKIGRDRIAESVKRAVEIHFARRMASR